VVIYVTNTHAVTYECAVKECDEEWIHPVQDSVQPRPHLKTVMTLWVPSVLGHILFINLIQK